MKADMGGTNILSPLNSIFKKPIIKGFPRILFLLTDGEVSDTDQVINLVRQNKKNTRVFTVGIGSGASPALIKGCAK